MAKSFKDKVIEQLESSKEFLLHKGKSLEYVAACKSISNLLKRKSNG
jgi:hypothetical protein